MTMRMCSLEVHIDVLPGSLWEDCGLEGVPGWLVGCCLASLALLYFCLDHFV